MSWLETNLLGMKMLNVGEDGLKFLSPTQHSFIWIPNQDEVIWSKCKFVEEGKLVHDPENNIFGLKVVPWKKCTCGIYSSNHKKLLQEYGYSESNSACFLLRTWGKFQTHTVGDDIPCAYALRTEGVELVAVVGEEDASMAANFAGAALFGLPVYPLNMAVDMITESWKRHKDTGYDPYDYETWRKHNYD